MFNTHKLMKSVSDLGGKVIKSTSKYVPAMLSEDKRFSNAYAACLALEIVSDMIIEEDETISAMKFIQTSPELKEMNLVIHTIEFYSKFISDLSEVIDTPHLYIVKKAKIIEENVSIIKNNSHKNIIKNMVIALAGNGNEKEKDVMNEILIALG